MGQPGNLLAFCAVHRFSGQARKPRSYCMTLTAKLRLGLTAVGSRQQRPDIQRLKAAGAQGQRQAQEEPGPQQPLQSPATTLLLVLSRCRWRCTLWPDNHTTLPHTDLGCLAPVQLVGDPRSAFTLSPLLCSPQAARACPSLPAPHPPERRTRRHGTSLHVHPSGERCRRPYPGSHVLCQAQHHWQVKRIPGCTSCTAWVH